MKQPLRVGESPAYARAIRLATHSIRHRDGEAVSVGLSIVTTEFARAEAEAKQNAEADTLPGLDPERTTISQCAGRVFVKYLASDGLYINENAYINSSYPLDVRGLIEAGLKYRLCHKLKIHGLH